VNWLDPEPDKESSAYEEYIKELQKIEEKGKFYRGLHQPPTEVEYKRRWEEYKKRRAKRRVPYRIHRRRQSEE
jgi:hypothetical protein